MHTALSHLGKIAAQHSDMTTNSEGGCLDDTSEWHCTLGNYLRHSFRHPMRLSMNGARVSRMRLPYTFDTLFHLPITRSIFYKGHHYKRHCSDFVRLRDIG